MLKLIKREIEDNAPAFGLAILLALILGAVAVESIVESIIGRNSSDAAPWGTSNTTMEIITIALPVYGSALIVVTTLLQSFVERSRKVHTFLATLPPTRNQILAARVVSGLLQAAIMVVPVAVATRVSIGMFQVRAIAAVYGPMATGINCVVFLLVVACFCTTLRLSLNRGLIWTVFASALVWATLIAVIFIKGLSMQAALFYCFVIASSLILTWRKFQEIPL